MSKLSYEIKFDERDLSEKTVNSYALKLSNYLEWIEEYSADSKYVNLSTHHNIHQDIINSYLNNYLIQDKAKGLEAVTQHRAALHSYYTYLEVKGFSNRKNIYIIPDLKDVARRSTNKRTAIKYLSPGLRITLTEYAKTKRDALLIRTSSECGLRTMENRGLLLNDFRVGNKTHKGLLSLFKEMEDNEDQLEFTYYLQGIYSKGSHSKGGKSREVFISKSLLQSMREYWAEERAISDIDHLFLNNSNNNKEAICESRASKVFAEIRDRVILAQEEGLLDEGEQAIEKGHTHHCLRVSDSPFTPNLVSHSRVT
ncbi:tyrosine-type recombinase/integrase [Colwellia sp. 6M3]|uniref:tyrosine-type recombinase/integrase n=1 Tax=Colwellia sp. 6M3 TaxID=2759849 RepID=UPI0015F75633|nr:tyrosine-type recombinase/integrase [Colwellia sp. 6M3]MBA6415141.1 tyrosine-type recombinase/integrase [Colwellia sp. 6M3]